MEPSRKLNEAKELNAQQEENTFIFKTFLGILLLHRDFSVCFKNIKIKPVNRKTDHSEVT